MFDKTTKTNKKTRVIYPALVIDTNDPFGQNRIKAEIKELADGQLAEIPWADPLLEINMPVEVGEAVWVFLPDPENPYSERLWVSRKISSFGNIPYDPYDTALRGTIHARTSPEGQNISYPPKNKDYSLKGKGGSEIDFEQDGISLSSNVRDRKDRTKTNSKNSRVKLKLLKKYGNTIGIQAENIYLASYSQTPKPPSNMDDDGMDRFIEQLHSIPRGDVLVNILKIFKEAIISHTHKYHNLPSDQGGASINTLNRVNFSNLNNDNIKIN